MFPKAFRVGAEVTVLDLPGDELGQSLATVEEVAEMVAFLCSSAAEYVNGASFSMDGGWTAR